MRHYEIIFIVHPDYSDQVPSMIEKYKKIITEKNGKMYRLEDWGRRQLAYSIDKLHKAHYILMNISVNTTVINILEDDFRFSNSIIRYIIINVKTAISNPSPMMKLKEDSKAIKEDTLEKNIINT
ncbi:MAG TPA: 30S ribosomal protein S6 [Buchnera sp. (in: enterobacteria)]|nr:30S ribosomal protein S6 [Buchnera sp. (in: enterobacteria)]